jgi:hypothetical protein
VELGPNARLDLLPKTEAQRTLEAVGSSAMFGRAWGSNTPVNTLLKS